MKKTNLKELQGKIGYTFKKESILIEALTHSSYAYENKVSSNERLEFLGDAILEMVITDYLYHKYPDKNEGELTTLRSSIVCCDSQYNVAIKLNFGKYLLLGLGEMMNRGDQKKNILSDAVEAIIGAIYLDGGLEKAHKFIHRFLLQTKTEPEIETKSHSPKPKPKPEQEIDSKSYFQQLAQKNGFPIPKYTLIREFGPEHNKNFEIEVTLNDIIKARATSTSKKKAEHEAAKKGIKILNDLLK